MRQCKDLAAPENNLDLAMMDRLAITSAGVQAGRGVRQVAALADPVGQISDGKYLPSGIHLSKMRVPWAWWGLSTSPSQRYRGRRHSVFEVGMPRFCAEARRPHSNWAIAEIVRASLSEAGLSMEQCKW